MRAAAPLTGFVRGGVSAGGRPSPAGTTVIADGAYLDTGLIVPHRRGAGRPLLRRQEEDNAEHRRVRARVEHTFARMENWKVLRNCRRKGDCLHQAVATLPGWTRRRTYAPRVTEPHLKGYVSSRCRA